MLSIKLTVRELMEANVDIDIYDDVCEAIGIAFCGPQGLTEEGKKHFAEVLDYEVEIEYDGRFYNGIVKVDDPNDKVWKHKLKKAKEFFYSAAGYCAADNWDKWFTDNDNLDKCKLILKHD